MEKGLEFRTIEQFEQYYFPESFEKDDSSAIWKIFSLANIGLYPKNLEINILNLFGACF